MLRVLRIALVGVGMLVFIGMSCNPAHAGTIIKLSLGGDAAPDIIFDGVSMSTVVDANGLTTGHQDTNVEFLDFLSGETDIIAPPPASFSMSGLATAGPATVIAGVLVIQDFTGGTFDLYDDSNGLLLSGLLDDSTLAGPIGPPATGALFTTSFATVTGGSLATKIDKVTLTLSMSFSDINGGAGFSVGVAAPILNAFT
ncbi:MAG: hypothetical protein WD971_10515, partial [Pirellulales bacterium]